MSVRYWRLLLGPSHQSSSLGGSIIQAMQDLHGVGSWHNNKSNTTNNNINYIAVVVVVSDDTFVLFAFSILYQVSTETARLLLLLLFCVMILLLMRFNLLLLELLLQKPRRLNALKLCSDAFQLVASNVVASEATEVERTAPVGAGHRDRRSASGVPSLVSKVSLLGLTTRPQSAAARSGGNMRARSCLSS